MSTELLVSRYATKEWRKKRESRKREDRATRCSKNEIQLISSLQRTRFLLRRADLFFGEAKLNFMSKQQ